MGNLYFRYFDRNEFWKLAQKMQAQYMDLDSSVLSSTASTVTAPGESVGLVSQDIQTSPDTALQILAVAMESEVIPYVSQATTTAGIAAYQFGGEFRVSYHQPQPPASGTGVNAATTGTLALRNIFFSQSILFGDVFTNLGNASSGIVQVMTPPSREVVAVFQEPITIVGSSIFTEFKLSGVSNSVNVYNRTQLLVRPVHISTQQYVNLVALATGQAILPPTILG